MYDLVVKHGQVIDGTGGPARQADVAVKDGRIVRIAPEIAEDAVEVLDATGAVVTPGFVDIHTHFDGQATWDSLLEPSTSHGVTTVVAGNCGVGFAPVRRGSEQRLIELMEGVEDIPGAALHEGMSWEWETFPEYLDVLDRQRWAADVGVQVPHGPLRAFAMGERAATRDAATREELETMARAVTEAVEAGALGFSTSRTIGHAALDGTPVPGTFAAADELLTIAAAQRDGGGGIFEVAGAGILATDDAATVASEMDWMSRLSRETGLTVTFIAMQVNHAPNRWRQDMEQARRWREKGASIVPLIAGRPFGLLLSWEARHPFRLRPSYQAIAQLPADERLARLRQPAVREKILAEEPEGDLAELRAQAFVDNLVPGCYVLADPPDYEQPFAKTLGALATAGNTDPQRIAYDALCAGAMLMFPAFNYTHGNHDVLWEQMQDPDAVLGLDDAGAHCAFICDASMPTYLLTHWIRDRTRGPRLDSVDAVRRLTSQPAELYGLTDRGRIAEGLRADINVIDLDRLRLCPPRPVHDLPAGGLRLLQDAVGIVSTVVAGQVTRRHGIDTGARPGRLLRGR
jgi:N-acyl-D-amino-acid deacylase